MSARRPRGSQGPRRGYLSGLQHQSPHTKLDKPRCKVADTQISPDEPVNRLMSEYSIRTTAYLVVGFRRCKGRGEKGMKWRNYSNDKVELECSLSVEPNAQPLASIPPARLRWVVWSQVPMQDKYQVAVERGQEILEAWWDLGGHPPPLF